MSLSSKAKASEQRLQSKYTLGIGGHMRKEDMKKGRDVLAWAKREFEEEVSYDGSYEAVPLGVLNDDSNDVGSVHFGIIHFWKLDEPKVQSREEEICHLNFMTFSELNTIKDKMESWSLLCLNNLDKFAMKTSR